MLPRAADGLQTGIPWCTELLFPTLPLHLFTLMSHHQCMSLTWHFPRDFVLYRLIGSNESCLDELLCSCGTLPANLLILFLLLLGTNYDNSNSRPIICQVIFIFIFFYIYTFMSNNSNISIAVIIVVSMHLCLSHSLSAPRFLPSKMQFFLAAVNKCLFMGECWELVTCK